MTIEEFAEHLKSKYDLSDDELIKYCDIIQKGLELMSTR